MLIGSVLLRPVWLGMKENEEMIAMTKHLLDSKLPLVFMRPLFRNDFLPVCCHSNVWQMGTNIGEMEKVNVACFRELPCDPEYVAPDNSAFLKKFERAVNGDDYYKVGTYLAEKIAWR